MCAPSAQIAPSSAATPSAAIAVFVGLLSATRLELFSEAQAMLFTEGFGIAIERLELMGRDPLDLAGQGELHAALTGHISPNTEERDQVGFVTCRNRAVVRRPLRHRSGGHATTLGHLKSVDADQGHGVQEWRPLECESLGELDPTWINSKFRRLGHPGFTNDVGLAGQEKLAWHKG